MQLLSLQQRQLQRGGWGDSEEGTGVSPMWDVFPPPPAVSPAPPGCGGRAPRGGGTVVGTLGMGAPAPTPAPGGEMGGCHPKNWSPKWEEPQKEPNALPVHVQPYRLGETSTSQYKYLPKLG